MSLFSNMHFEILSWRVLLFGVLIIVNESAATEQSDFHSSRNHFAIEESNSEIFIEFAFRNLSFVESPRLVAVPVIRSDKHLNSAVSVTCSISTVAAKNTQSYQPQSAGIAKFVQGQQIAMCCLGLHTYHFNDQDVVFELHLNNAFCDACGHNEKVTIGTNSVMSVTIEKDDSDTPPTTIQFERASYEIQEPSSDDHAAILSIKLIRAGDIEDVSTVRVETTDDVAVSGESYHAKTTLVRFEERQAVQSFDVEILHNSARKYERQTFTVHLVAEDLTNAAFGSVTVSVVTIISRTWNAIFPAPPTVISLPYFNSRIKMVNNLRSPSYPLICVTSCSPQYYDYLKMKTFCENNGVNISMVKYSWEVRLPKSTTDHFQLLLRNTLFTSVDTMILDTTFFRSGYLVRCTVRPTSDSFITGMASKSEPVQISSNVLISYVQWYGNLKSNDQISGNFNNPATVWSRWCPIRGSPEWNLVSYCICIFHQGVCGESSLKLAAPFPFVAKLSYSNVDDPQHPSRLQVQVDIPHQDGMLPIISTKSLRNLPLLIGNEFSPRRLHFCSNLILPGESAALNSESLFLNTQNQQLEDTRQYDIMSKNATLLYRHLDLEKCIWRFNAYFSMGDLVDLCGGIVSNSRIEVGGKRHTTIRVPLYVANVFAAGNLWTSVEHQTEMEFSFDYDSLLLPSGLEIESDVDAHLHIHRIYLEDNGNLVINFQTKPKFNGLFVMQHRSMTDIRSSLVFPKFTDLQFDLRLLWTADSNNEPIQSWRAVSGYSLKDYTGVYILELIPCIFIASSKNIANDISSTCVNRKLKRFEIPIVYQQVSRPTPVVFSLKTHFHLTNSETRFLVVSNDDDSNLQDDDIGIAGPFGKGENVYGKVHWNPGQDLGTAYKLQIEKVYLCADVINTEVNLAESNSNGDGCFSPHFKHRVLLLDRNIFQEEFEDSDVYSVLRSEARFIEDDESFTVLQKASGVDGFIFKVDGLLNFGSSYQWFVQVIYYISSSSRKRRSTTGSDNQPLHNGTVMRHLDLIVQSSTPVSQTLVILNIVVSLIVIISLIVLIVKRRHSTSVCNISNILQRRRNYESELTNSCCTPSQSSIICYSCRSYNVTIKPSSVIFIPSHDTTEV